MSSRMRKGFFAEHQPGQKLFFFEVFCFDKRFYEPHRYSVEVKSSMDMLDHVFPTRKDSNDNDLRY
jgi:hypothetical protein